MKAILEFDLPEDDEDYEIVTNAFKIKRVVDDFDQFLRNKIKYGKYDMKFVDKDGSEITEEDIYQEIRDHLYNIANEEGAEIGL